MQEIPISTNSFRRQLADLLTAVMVTSAKVAAQEEAEENEGPVEVAIGVASTDTVDRVRQFTKSPAYQHALKAYVEGTISLDDLARALDPLRPAVPWLCRKIRRTPQAAPHAASTINRSI